MKPGTKVQPIIFCFLGDVATRLRDDVSRRIAERLGELPDVVAFVHLAEGGVELSVGGIDDRFAVDRGEGGPPESAGRSSSRLLEALVAARSVIDKAIQLERKSSGAVSEDEEATGIVTISAEPQIIVIQGFADPLGPGSLLSLAEKLHSREERWIGKPRIRAVLLREAPPGGVAYNGSTPGRVGLRWVETAIDRGILDSAAVIACAPEEHSHVAGFFSASATDRWVDFLSLLPNVEFHDALAARIGDGLRVAGIGVAAGVVGGELLEPEFERKFFRELRRALDESQPRSDADLDRILDDRLIADLARDRTLHHIDGAARLAEVLDRRLAKEIREGQLISTDTPKLAERLRVRSTQLQSAAARRLEREISEPIIERSDLTKAQWKSSAGFWLFLMLLLGALAGAWTASRLLRPDIGTILAGVVFGAVAALLAWLLLRYARGGELFSQADGETDAEVDESREPDRDVDDLDISPAEYDPVIEAAARLESLTRASASSDRASLDELCAVDTDSGELSGLGDPSRLSTEIVLLLRQGFASCLPLTVEGYADSPFLLAVRERAREWARRAARDVSPSLALRREHALPRRVLDGLTRSAAPAWPGGGGALSSLRCFSSDLEGWSGDGDLIAGGERSILVVRVMRSIDSHDLVADGCATDGNVVGVE
jgi:hypothetical protein